MHGTALFRCASKKINKVKKKYKILIVEDSTTAMLYTSDIVRRAGYEVIEAINGKVALQKLRGGTIDMVISDILMPEMDGFQLLKHVREDDNLKDIPFIFRTATYTSDKDRAFGFKLGVDEYIRKFSVHKVLTELIQDIFKKVEAGGFVPNKPIMGQEGETYKLYNERLVRKLEKKMLDLENETIEHKKAEEDLKQSEENYRNIFDSNPLPLGEEDWSGAKELLEKEKTKGRAINKEYFDENPEFFNKCMSSIKVIQVNRAILDLFKYKTSDGFIHNILDIFTERAYETNKNELIAVANDEPTFSEETELLDSEGNLISAIVQYKIVGSYKKVIFSVIDITERKKAEEALIASKEKFHTVADFAYDWEYWISPQDEFIYISPSCERITGYKPNEFKQNPGLLTSIVHPDDVDNWKNHKHHAFNKAEIESIEFRIIKKSGEECWIGHVCQTVYNDNGDNIGIRGSNRNITDSKKTEEALKVSEDRLSKTLMAANDGMWDWDLTTNKVYFDPRYYEMAGYAIDGFPHEFDEFQKRVHPDDFENVLSQAQQHIEGKIARFRVEFRFKKKSGDWLWVLGRGLIVEHDVNNRPLRFIGTHTDITERKKAEEEIIKINSKLTATINALPDLMFETDNEGRIYDYHAQKSDLLYAKPEDFLGKKIDEILPTAAAKICNNAISEAIGTGKYSGAVYSLQLPRGLSWFELSIATKDDANTAEKRAIMLVRDITGRKKAEEELKSRMQELEIFNEVTVDRELLINGLRDEVNSLLNKLGKERKYDIVQ
ncbi:MAG: hypothetical protein B6D64_02210 [Bacteroidetes bacterium 4484_276]|nr:MAG: hypothetical protein B6D64_02210 [Bacteroidetes bacterium 4484_276]